MSSIVWLASYPRSGNTLLRAILNECLDVVAGSKYDEGQNSSPMNELLGKSRGFQSQLVKTHDHPESDAPAIVAVRDGCASIVSYWHYLTDYVAPVQMEEVIKGNVGYGSWSDHFRAWDPERRPNTLLLRFEDFSVNPEIAVEAAAEFLNVRPLRSFSKNFADLQRLDPKFFRSGNNASNIQEMADDDLSLFSDLHGPLMKQLGYW